MSRVPEIFSNSPLKYFQTLRIKNALIHKIPLDEKRAIGYNRLVSNCKDGARVMLELANHKKIAAVIAILLCLPLLLIGWYSFRLLSGATVFKDISEVVLTLPDGTEKAYTQENEIDFFVGILERASVIESPVRNTAGETPLTVALDGTEYKLYPSLSVSGCMVKTPDGGYLLLTGDDASLLVVRDELEYLYESHRLPSLSVVSNDKSYAVLPDGYTWNYRKADGIYYKDETTATSSELLTCNLYTSGESALSFSVEPSHYSLKVHHYDNGTLGYELPVTSLAGLHFTQDTLLSIEISAKWSQASNAQQYGEAHYRFLALYDVPAEVELIGGKNNALTVKAGGFVLLRALYTNANEALSVRANFRTDNLQFYYDARTGSSYAALPVARENASGDYELQVFSGDNTYTYTVTVKDGSSDGFLSAAVSDEDYAAFYTPEQLAAWEQTLADLRAASVGTPFLNADLAFAETLSNDVTLEYGSSVLIGNQAAEDDAGLHTLEGTVIKAKKGTEAEAIQSGVCVFAGTLGAGGNTVILDHGCGIFTYYYSLDEIAVEVGDEVSRSHEVGTVGTSGYTQDQTPYLYFAMSIGDIYVNPIAE